MKKRCILPILISIILTIPAFGQVRKVDPDKTENIRRLMKILGMEKLQQTMTDQVLAALKPMFSQSNGEERTRKILDRLSEIMSEEFKKLDFTTTNADLYDKYFTTEEIKGLIQFYESPVGQKAIQVLPALTQEAMNRGMEQGRLVGVKAISRLVEEFPELKNKLPASPGK